MTKIDDLTERIRELTGSYSPSAETQVELSTKIICPIVAPFAVGKTSLMQAMEEVDSDFRYVRGFTTRPPRSADEDAYTFRPHTLESLQEIVSQLENGELVQAVIHPTNGYVYASDLESYSAPYNTLDVLTSALKPLEEVGFSNIISLYLVCPVEEWAHRLSNSQQASTMDTGQVSERWHEAILSLEYALSHKDSFLWLENPSGKLESAAQLAISAIRSQQPANLHLSSMAQKMLDYARQQL